MGVASLVQGPIFSACSFLLMKELEQEERVMRRNAVEMYFMFFVLTSPLTPLLEERGT